MDDLFSAVRHGRYASTVRIVNPASAYLGRIGTVHRLAGGSIIVRFPDGTRLAFGPREVEEHRPTSRRPW